MEVFQSKLVLKIVWPGFVWLLLTGGHYTEVIVNTGLAVDGGITIKEFLIWKRERGGRRERKR